MSAQISSQYVSGVLLAAPLAKSPLTLQLKEDKPISEPYIDMTIGMMKVAPPFWAEDRARPNLLGEDAPGAPAKGPHAWRCAARGWIGRAG